MASVAKHSRQSFRRKIRYNVYVTKNLPCGKAYSDLQSVEEQLCEFRHDGTEDYKLLIA